MICLPNLLLLLLLLGVGLRRGRRRGRLPPRRGRTASALRLGPAKAGEVAAQRRGGGDAAGVDCRRPALVAEAGHDDDVVINNDD